MDEGGSSGFASTPGNIDRSKVHTVKPLRSLVPVFVYPPADASSSYLPGQGPPFVYAPPSGPFQQGCAPFYPFCLPTEHLQTQQHNVRNAAGASNPEGPSEFNYPVHSPIPATAFRARGQKQHEACPNDGYKAAANGNAIGSGFVEEDGYEDPSDQTTDYPDADPGVTERQKTKPYKWTKTGEVNSSVHAGHIDKVAGDFLSKLNLVAFDASRQTDGEKESVHYILLVYDMLRRRITQFEEVTGVSTGVRRRPDLRAGKILMNKGIRTNVKKRIGMVPGIEVGDIFFFRMEMCLAGLHAQAMAGIDCMNIKGQDGPLAVSIVSSGAYDDNTEDGDTLVYSGHGGNIYNRRAGKQEKDQELERGNLALAKSLQHGSEVRVIRGLKDLAHLTGKVYVYDGLYKIQCSWSEMGKAGHNVFKYKLVRLPGQPAAFLVWKLIQQWKDGAVARAGCITQDMTSGFENKPVCVVNEVDVERGPAHFTYLPALKYPAPIKPLNPCSSCGCSDGCQSGDPRCSCIQKNGGHLPCSPLGVVMHHQSLISECGPACQCPKTCRNRVSQAGLKVQLEVFKTRDRGWGLRSWDPIRAGGFICQYAGEVVEKHKLERDDYYIFDSARYFEPLDATPCNLYAADKMPFPLVISSRRVGNVARFMNHSCSPNVFWLPVVCGNSDQCTVHVAFFAIKSIPPMTELSFDYGMVQSQEEDYRKQKCLCGSAKCRGFFY